MATPQEVAALDARMLCEDLPASLCVADRTGRIRFASARWRDVHGRGAGAMLFDDPDSGANAAAWSEAVELGRPSSFVALLLDAGGTPRRYRLDVEPMRDPDGAALGIAVSSAVEHEGRFEDYLRLLGDAGDVLAHESDVDVALARIGQLVVPLVSDRFVFHRPSGDGGYVVKLAVHARTEPGEPAARRSRRTPSGALVRVAAQRGEAIIVTPQSKAETGRARLIAPVAGGDGIWGALEFSLDAGSTRSFGDAELQVGRELAKRTAAAIEGRALVATARDAADDLRFLAQVGETMVESLDLDSRLDRFVNAVVPRLADWATVNLVVADGTIETVAIAHRDARMRPIVERLRGPYYGNTGTNQGTPVALRTGRPRLLTGVDESFLRVHIRPETFGDVLELGADSSFIVPLSAHGEIYGTLSAMRTERERPFTENDMWLIEELARRAAVAISHARLFERSTSVADAFQNASLPERLPSVAGATFSAHYAPGSSEATVGGDWYDAFTLSDETLALSIGDVSGSGLSAAVVMGSVRQVIRGIAQIERDPAAILDATDRALRTEYPGAFVTAFVALLDRARRTIVFASAGHPPPLMYDDGSVRTLDASGLPLGLRTDDAGGTRSTAYGDDAMLALYTDGLIESTRDVIAGEAAARAAFERPEVRGAQNPARALHDTVLPHGAADDVAILVVALHDA